MGEEIDEAIDYIGGILQQHASDDNLALDAWKTICDTVNAAPQRKKLKLPEYAVGKDGWWYRWNYRYGTYVALKKEYWPTENNGNGEHILQQPKV